MIDKDQVNAWLRMVDPTATLWVGVGQKPDGGFFAAPEPSTMPVARVFDYFSKFNAAKTHMFVCPAPRPAGARRKKGTAALSHVIWSDFDASPERPELIVPDKLRDHTRLVPSGRPGNFHVYVPLSRPVRKPENISLLNWLLTKAIHGDAKWSDDSLLRLPGSINPKTGARVGPIPAVGRRTQIHPQALLDMLREYAGGMDLRNLRDMLGVTGGRSEPMRVIALTTAERRELMARLPSKTRSILRSNMLRTKGDISRTFYGFWRDFYAAGLTIDQTYALMQHFEPATTDYAERLDEDLPRCWAKYEKAAQR